MTDPITKTADLAFRMNVVMQWTLAAGTRDEYRKVIEALETRRDDAKNALKGEDRKVVLSCLNAVLARVRAFEQFRNRICNVLGLDPNTEPERLREAKILPEDVRWATDAPPPKRIWRPGDPL